MEQEDIKATAEEMKQEAVRRLKMINYYAPAIERFEKEGVIMFSEFGSVGIECINGGLYQTA
jgi:hypothetical protein